MRSTQVWIVIAALTAVGLGAFAYKARVLAFPVFPESRNIYWDVEAKVSFEGRGGPAEVRLARVNDTPHLAVLDEDYLSPRGFGVTRTRIGAQRFAAFERRALNSRAIVFYRAVLVQLDSGVTPRRSARPDAVSEFKADDRRAAAREEQTPFLFALDNLIGDAEQASSGEAGFIAQIVQSLSDSTDERVRALRAGGPRALREPASRLAFVLNAADIPARRVEGLFLAGGERDLPVQRWVDVWTQGRWIPMDPRTGERLEAQRLLPLNASDRPLVRHSGVDDVFVSFAVERRSESALIEALRRSDERAALISAISLTTLPVHVQDVFEVIMLVPVGALLIAFLRQVVGLASFGTFMPVLIALSFRETSLLTGLALFVSIVMVGLSLRSYFNSLQLLVVPRLAAVLTIVTLLMAAIALVGHAFAIPLGLSISLFPIVILTMTIERMSLVWDEYGAREALIQGAGSLAAAVAGYLIMSNRYVEHWVFTFPELLLVALAAMIALGRYNGYKLTEYYRFRGFARPDGGA